MRNQKCFLLITVLFAMLITSCSQRVAENADTDTTQITQINSNNPDSLSKDESKRMASLESVMSSINELDSFPVFYDVRYFDNYDSLTKLFSKSFTLPCDTLSNGIISESILCEDGVHFIWKKTFEDYTLIDFATTYFNPKGRCVYHHLITVDDLGFVIDSLPEWAAQYAVSVENPNGGTSAGVETKSGNIDGAQLIIISTKEDGTTETTQLFDDGKFIKISNQ